MVVMTSGASGVAGAAGRMSSAAQGRRNSITGSSRLLVFGASLTPETAILQTIAKLKQQVQMNLATAGEHGHEVEHAVLLSVTKLEQKLLKLEPVAVPTASPPDAGASTDDGTRARPSSVNNTSGTPGLPDRADPSTGEDRGLRWQIFTVLDDTSSRLGQVTAIVVMLLIVVSTVAFLLESMDQFTEHPAECAELLRNGQPLTLAACRPLPHASFATVEVVCIMVFTVEYLGRMLNVQVVKNSEAGLDPSVQPGLVRTLRYASQAMNIIDFVAIFPFYLELMIGGAAGGLAVLRVLRLARVFRIFKLGKYNQGLSMFVEVLKRSAPAVSLTMFFYFIITVLFAALIYFCEMANFDVGADWTTAQCNGTNVDELPACAQAAITPGTGTYTRPTVNGHSLEQSPFASIPLAFWWVMTTTTTVGYGDFYPTTTSGKLVGILCFYVGIVFLAMPITILGLNFEEIYNEQQMLKRFGKAEDDNNEPAGPELDIDSEEAIQERVQAAAWQAACATEEAARNVAMRRVKTRERLLKQFTPDSNVVAPAGQKQQLRMHGSPWFPLGCATKKEWLFLLLEDAERSKAGKVMSIVILTLIMISTMAFLLATMQQFQITPDACNDLLRAGLPLTPSACIPQPQPIFDLLETICIGVFTVEYIARALTLHAVPLELAGFIDDDTDAETKKKLAQLSAFQITKLYLKRPMNVIDLVAILPFYLELMMGGGGGGLAILRILRLARLFRVLRMRKYSEGVAMFGNVLSGSLPALSILMFMSVLCMVLFGALIYFAEGAAYSVDQDGEIFPMGVAVRRNFADTEDEPTPFRSVPSAFWWVATTLTTVGYGDIAPTTPIGRCIGVLTFFAGIINLALPVTIIGANFSIYYGTWVEDNQIEKVVQQQLEKENREPEPQPPRLEAKSKATEPRKGVTWRCEGCGSETNLNFMQSCMKCYMPRRAAPGPAAATWRCESCATESRSTYKLCSKCKKPRRAAAPAAGAGGAAGAVPAAAKSKPVPNGHGVS
jgi:hypothetical protein